ncbi:MAG: tripartite tricarboxylate transporter substrate binding protein [Proteobacteria bacterium]|nr:tripartite tricarboxylate transporter substrate binding protein [Burkholderiales bacterium]
MTGHDLRDARLAATVVRGVWRKHATAGALRPGPLLGALLLAALAGIPVASAQSFPSKPLRLVVPFAPGGTGDLLGRILAQAMGETIGQPIVVDNRPGAGGNIGAEIIARSTVPDGYNLLLAATSLASNVSLMRKLPYDPVKDLSPIGMVAVIPNIAVVHPSLPVKSIKELVALAKARPGQLSFGSAGNGTSSHLAVELFKVAAGVDIVHVPYKSGGPAMLDLMGGQIQLMFELMPSALPFVKAGKLRAFAVTSAKRSSVVPQLPTVAEAGVPGYEFAGWFGVFAPPGVPANVAARLNAALNKALENADVRQRLAEQGAEPSPTSPEQLGKFLRGEIDKWAQVVKAGKLPLLE